jgi:hypothetical protein
MNTITRPLFSLVVSAALASCLVAQNNECTGALMAVQGVNGPFTNVGATTSAPVWPCGSGNNDVWFSVVTGGPGTLTVTTCGATFDTVLQIFSGSCGSLTSLGCNDDACGSASSVAVPVVANTYFVRVGGYTGATGSFPLNITGPVSGALATNTTLGTGCQRLTASFYELFAPAAFDLNNTTITMVPSGGSYSVHSGTVTYLPPSASATVLSLQDDSEATVLLAAPMPFPGGSTTALTVNSNGVVSIAVGNGPSPYWSTQAFLDAMRTAWRVWSDFDPSIGAGGRVKFEQVGSKAIVTWDGVWNFGGISPSHANTFQFQFDTSTGFVHLVIQSLSPVGSSRLVGYSPGGTSLDPGAIDISAALPASFVLPAADALGLALTATTRPVLGATWSLNVTNVPASGTLGVDIVGFTDPGFNDLTFLGMPGCGLRSSLEVVSPWAPLGGSHTYLLAVPGNPALVDYHLFTTSAVFVPGANAFGAITANGIDGKLGSL